MDILDLWINLPYQSYTWQTAQGIVDSNPFAVAFMFLVLVFGVGMGNEITNMILAKKEGHGPISLWQQSYNFGVDTVFVLLFPLWFGVIDFWLWKLYCVLNLAYVLFELAHMKTMVETDRQRLFGKYYDGKEVPIKDAWRRCIESYALGLLLAIVIRFALGDTMGLLLFLSTIMINFGMHSWDLERQGSRQGMSWSYIIWNFAVVICSYLPAGLGFYATVIPVLDSPYVYLLGLVNLYGVCRTAYVYHKLPPKPAEINGNKVIAYLR